MFDYSKCKLCDFNVCGCGSETCSAVVGDFCLASSSYIEETEEDKKFLQEIQKKS